ncbi:hypothetical protein CSUI_003625 [Cystoisospora suis]|uniref:Uncharacterized protein n=1 Tax=Cystoisospora suis TaxID=483139 RepID=A0A2C6KET2_9APIC|nr:hypothetical protein CSUI_003625 [Cystoisospora suis]
MGRLTSCAFGAADGHTIYKRRLAPLADIRLHARGPTIGRRRRSVVTPPGLGGAAT